jgi:hypothetical protein
LTNQLLNNNNLPANITSLVSPNVYNNFAEDNVFMPTSSINSNSNSNGNSNNKHLPINNFLNNNNNNNNFNNNNNNFNNNNNNNDNNVSSRQSKD